MEGCRQEGEVLDVLVQTRRNKAAVLKLPRKLLKNQAIMPEQIVTDGLASYKAACANSAARIAIGRAGYGTTIGLRTRTRRGRRRERKMQRFKSQGQARRLVSVHGPIYNTFNIQRHLISRNTMRQFRAAAMAKWNVASATAR